jgi:hypothetical protein
VPAAQCDSHGGEATGQLLHNWQAQFQAQEYTRRDVHGMACKMLCCPVTQFEKGAGGEGRVPVVHNYGHGGAGITLSWGCALDTLTLVKQALG